MSTVAAFVRLSRPRFLVGGVLFFALGAAFGEGIGVGASLLGQTLVASVQLTAHYVNEYADREADRTVERRTFFSGEAASSPPGSSPRAWHGPPPR